jgi:hypothetical protein
VRRSGFQASASGNTVHLERISSTPEKHVCSINGVNVFDWLQAKK